MRAARTCAVAAFTALLTAALPAHADTPPNAWDVARDPAARDRWALHVRVERLLTPGRAEDDPVPDPRVDGELRLEAARAMLEGAGAATGPDARLRFDLGRVYYRLAEQQGGRVDLLRRAIDVLAPTLAAGDDQPGATEAMVALVYAYAKTNQPREELATWRRYIPRLVDDRDRVQAMMNMGEAEMRLGHVDDATATFREVLRLCSELPNTSVVGSTYVLTLFDLAVALDRSGDARTALDTAGKASRMNVLDSRLVATTGAGLIARDPNVFFVPEWEREWYLALIAAAAARDTNDPRQAAALWAQSERHWERYVDDASAAGGKDTWLGIARQRLARTHAERVAAEQRAAKMPRHAQPRSLPWVDEQ